MEKILKIEGFSTTDIVALSLLCDSEKDVRSYVCSI
jgi:hypothetical protein